jgi:hypothetical protein
VSVVVGLARPLVVDQVDGLGADQPEVPPDFGKELALAECFERSLERLEEQQFELALCSDLEEFEDPGFERSGKPEGGESPVDNVQSSYTGIQEACPVRQ